MVWGFDAGWDWFGVVMGCDWIRAGSGHCMVNGEWGWDGTAWGMKWGMGGGRAWRWYDMWAGLGLDVKWDGSCAGMVNEQDWITVGGRTE